MKKNQRDRTFSLLLSFLAFLFSSFSSLFDTFAFDSRYGVFERVEGSVHILDPESQKKNLAQQGTSVHPGDQILSSDQSEAEIRMEDGSQILLTSNSKIQIEEKEKKFLSYFITNQVSKKKTLIRSKIPYYISLLSGNIRTRFQTENQNPSEEEEESIKDPRTRTYQVRTKVAVIGVRGTDFLTSHDEGAFSTKVTTFEGEVFFFPMEEKTQDFLSKVSVIRGEQITYVFSQSLSPPILIDENTLDKLKEETKFKTPTTKDSLTHKDSSSSKAKATSLSKNQAQLTEIKDSIDSLPLSDSEESFPLSSALSLPEDLEIKKDFFPKEDPFFDSSFINPETNLLNPQGFSNCLSFSCRLEERLFRVPSETIELSVEVFHRD